MGLTDHHPHLAGFEQAMSNHFQYTKQGGPGIWVGKVSFTPSPSFQKRYVFIQIRYVLMECHWITYLKFKEVSLCFFDSPYVF
jgi:hypothetical protein